MSSDLSSVFVPFLSVFVGQSLISGAGEGLFAKTDAGPDTVMAFYNGVRITHSEVMTWTVCLCVCVCSVTLYICVCCIYNWLCKNSYGSNFQLIPFFS